jgi:high-affinity nickel permease
MFVGSLWAIPSAATTIASAFCPVLVIATLTLGGTAWMLGRHDLRAIRSGAMDPTGMKMTRQGHRLGVVGTLISVGVIVAFVGSLALR